MLKVGGANLWRTSNAATSYGRVGPISEAVGCEYGEIREKNLLSRLIK